MGVDITVGFETGNDMGDDYPKTPIWDIKMRRILKVCNPPTQMTIGSEGVVESNHSLEGVIIFLRHGDRGPMSHVRNVTNVNCSSDLLQENSLMSSSAYPAFKAFIENLSAQNARDRFLGRLSDFPLSPPLTGECQLGQLTTVGLAQMLQLGKLLREVYADKLGLKNGSLTRENTKLYTTRYRRTVQSTVAFLSAFLGQSDLAKMTLHESFSVAFCFDDCACPAAEKFARRFAKERGAHFRAHPAVVELVKHAAPLVYDALSAPLAADPHALRDAFLAYVCHGAQLPCSDTECLKIDSVTGLFAYTEWEARQYARSSSLRHASMLRAYGALRNVGTHLLSLVSERRPRFVLYSGHDMTLQYLTAALGIMASVSPHYASRLVLEVYRTDDPSDPPSPQDFSFRLVYNGRDVTSKVPFCHGKGLSQQHEPTSGEPETRRSAYLCPIESIVRFLHDDYFLGFNATNFKDACNLRS